MRIDRQRPVCSKLPPPSMPTGMPGGSNHARGALGRPSNAVGALGQAIKVRVFLFLTDLGYVLLVRGLKPNPLRVSSGFRKSIHRKVSKSDRCTRACILRQCQRVAKARGMKVSIGDPQVRLESHKERQRIVRVGVIGDPWNAAAHIVARHPLARQAEPPIGGRGCRDGAIGRRNA